MYINAYKTPTFTHKHTWFPPPPDKCVFACVCACVHVYVREHKQALQAKFIAAPRYQGSKDGYVFKNAVRGLYVYVCMCIFPSLFSAVFSTLFCDVFRLHLGQSLLRHYSCAIKVCIKALLRSLLRRY